MNLKTLTKDVQKVSQQYTTAYNIEADSDWYILKLQEEIGELIQAYLMMKNKARTKGKTPDELKADFDKEVVDVLCHTLLVAGENNVNLEKIIEEKWLVWTKK